MAGGTIKRIAGPAYRAAAATDIYTSPAATSITITVTGEQVVV